MGRGDNRKSRKTIQRRGQAKKKARARKKLSDGKSAAAPKKARA